MLPTTFLPVQRAFVLLVTLAMALGAIVPLLAPAPTRAAPTELFFSEYIEGTSNNKALEIYNGTGVPINLGTSGYSVQMFFNGSPTAGLTISLTGTVASGDVYVLAHLSANATIQAQADQTNGSGWFNGNDAVALRHGTTLIDVIGQIGFDPGSQWGTGLASTADNTLRRHAAIEAGDPNGSDAFLPGAEWDGYATDTFNALGAHPGEPDSAPSVAGTLPAGGAVDVQKDDDISITFSEAVAVSGTWYEIDCSTSGLHTAVVSGGSTTFTLDPDVDFVTGDTCQVTVFAAGVTDADAADPPDAMNAHHAFSFGVGTSCPTATHLIHEVQGAGLATPIGGTIVTVNAVVVGDFQGPAPALRGFFLQEEDAEVDVNPATSEALFVFDGSGAVAVGPGDLVSVTGRATEFGDVTQIDRVSDVTVCDSGLGVTPAEITLPVASLNDWERWEGMLADFTQPMTVTETFSLGRFGEVVLSSTGRQYQGTHEAAPGTDALAVADLNARTRIVLDDGRGGENLDPTVYPAPGLSASNTLRTGATVAGLTAIVSQGFGAYRLQPVGPIAFAGAAERPASPPVVGGRMQVAAFNVLNYFNGDGAGGGFPTSRGAETPLEFARQHDKIVAAIGAMDAEVLGLMEIENDGADDAPAIETLVDGLNEAVGAGTYAYIETGDIGTDEIAVAIIYQPAEVTPLGDHAILDSSVDPRFVDTANRPALAQSFTETATGAVFTVAVNHLKSKGSGCGAGDDQPDHLGGNCNGTRTAAAEALGDWLASDPTGSDDPDAVIIGDLNSYRMETPIAALRDAGFTDLLAEFEGADAYTYVFMGASGYLDHAQATASFREQVTDAAPWHVNTDEPTVLDYNTNFKSDNHITSLYAADPFRSSDHDPVIVGLDLQLHSKVTGGGTVATTAGRASFQLSAQYEGSSIVPSGETTFDVPGVAFESTSVEWLVAEVDGSAAHYGGTGTVNGDAGYRFLVAVTDGPDRLRVKIWNVATGEVVFDNQPGEPDDAAASQPIRSGQVRVHGG
ncbi:MAG TPA: ExeM/NucH family extracellular endonuclease [Candidatus Limnocylindrales bacterium]|nr:ExeM/NucH family extracellular endonuclease [Candidatus Limnocylindrales bacterium]